MLSFSFDCLHAHRLQHNEIGRACPKPELSGFIRPRLRFFAEDLLSKMLEYSNTDELDLDDHDLEDIF